MNDARDPTRRILLTGGDVLPRSLGIRDVFLLVVGMMAGSGVFVVPATTTRLTGGFIGPALLVWIVGGGLSMLGALSYAELGAMRPEAGGLYVFIRDAFGRLPAFLYGWMLFAVMGSGILAALAIAATAYVDRLWPLGPVWIRVTPLVLIACVAFVNIVGTRQSARLNNWATVIKVLAIGGLSVAFIVRSKGIGSAAIWPTAISRATAAGFGAAILG